MRRVLAVVALLALAVLPAGCSGTPPEGDAAATASRPPTAGEIRLVITRDYGASLLKDVLVDAAGGTDVMRLLAENAEVSSGYGGGFVAGIDGLESTFGGASSAGAADWFYWVDGALADIGAGDNPLGGGETVWWDYHRWAGAMFAPTAVHAFPVPWAGRPLPVTGGGGIAGLDEWAPTVGLELGQRRDLAAGGPPDGLVVCTSAEAAATPWLAALLSGEAGAPLVAVGDGTLSALGADGAAAAATAAVLALPNADDPARPLLLLLFADAAAAGDAFPLFTPASLGARLAAAVVGDAVVPLPLETAP